MRYFLDTEFEASTGNEIDLISLALVAEDGRELYLQSCAFKPRRMSDWVREHVLNQLVLCPHVHVRGGPSPLTDVAVHAHEGQCIFSSAEGTCGYEPDCPWRTREQMKQAVATFCDAERYGPPVFWGRYASYDFVVLCQLFGGMVELPKGWPCYIRDLQYLLDASFIDDALLPVQTETAHHALADARHLLTLWHWLQTWERIRKAAHWIASERGKSGGVVPVVPGAPALTGGPNDAGYERVFPGITTLDPNDLGEIRSLRPEKHRERDGRWIDERYGRWMDDGRPTPPRRALDHQISAEKDAAFRALREDFTGVEVITETPHDAAQEGQTA